MGRIIRNGIEYGSGNENATNINYDNSLSGLEATTVQEAIDKLAVDGFDANLSTMSMEWDYENKIDISAYNSANNFYTLPSNGIIYFNGTDYFGVIDVDMNASAFGLYVPNGSYRQANFIGYKGQKIYFNNCSIAYFIPLKYKNLGGSGNGSSESEAIVIDAIDMFTVSDGVQLQGAVLTGKTLYIKFYVQTASTTENWVALTLKDNTWATNMSLSSNYMNVKNNIANATKGENTIKIRLANRSDEVYFGTLIIN